MGPKTKGRGGTKRCGGKRSAHQLQQKVRSPKYGNSRKCFCQQLKWLMKGALRRTWLVMRTRSHRLVALQGSQRSCPTRFVQLMKKSWLISSETIPAGIIFAFAGHPNRTGNARWRCGAVPLRYRHAHCRTDTWLVAGRMHVEGTAKAWRQYVECAFAVGFSACDSVRRRHGGRKRRALPVRWLQNPF